MHLGLVAWVISSSACASPITSAAAAQAPDPAQPVESSDVSVHDAVPDETGWGTAAGLRYLEIVRGGASAKEKLPLLIVIHGLGDKPNRGWLETIDVDSKIKARMILPQAPTAHGSGYSWFPFRAATLDQEALARGISAAAEGLARMITVLQTQRATSSTKAVITGFSQGGMLSYALALGHPELVAYALPISGMLPGSMWPVSLPASAPLPALRALHGTADTVVRSAFDEQLVTRLRELGASAEFVPFAGVGHSITKEMSEAARSALSAALAPPKELPPPRRAARAARAHP